MTRHEVLRVVSKALVPIILLFAFYVQFHGDFGPGGGFQAGVIFAAGVILFTLIYGLPTVEAKISPRLLEVGMALGVMIYGGTGVVSLLLGGNFLDYNVLSGDPHHTVHGQHLGIFSVEAGVGITVACVMMVIFNAFAGRAAERKRQADTP